MAFQLSDIDPRADFESLVTTIGSVYELRGIGVSYVKACHAILDWMLDQSKLRPFGESSNSAEQCFSEADVKINDSGCGNVAITMKPWGADKRIPVGIKRSGNNPWSITVEYKEED